MGAPLLIPPDHRGPLQIHRPDAWILFRVPPGIWRDPQRTKVSEAPPTSSQSKPSSHSAEEVPTRCGVAERGCAFWDLLPSPLGCDIAPPGAGNRWSAWDRSWDPGGNDPLGGFGGRLCPSTTQGSTLSEGSTTEGSTLSQGSTTEGSTTRGSILSEGSTLSQGSTTEGSTLSQGSTTEGSTAEGSTIEGSILSQGSTTEGSTTEGSILSQGSTTEGSSTEGSTIEGSILSQGSTTEGSTTEGSTLKAARPGQTYSFGDALGEAVAFSSSTEGFFLHLFPLSPSLLPFEMGRSPSSPQGVEGWESPFPQTPAKGETSGKAAGGKPRLHRSWFSLLFFFFLLLFHFSHFSTFFFSPSFRPKTLRGPVGATAWFGSTFSAETRKRNLVLRRFFFFFLAGRGKNGNAFLLISGLGSSRA
ncbi:uncharacterized protein M6G45_016161 [Spheniscus humboldti]